MTTYYLTRPFNKARLPELDFFAPIDKELSESAHTRSFLKPYIPNGRIYGIVRVSSPLPVETLIDVYDLAPGIFNKEWKAWKEYRASKGA